MTTAKQANPARRAQHIRDRNNKSNEDVTILENVIIAQQLLILKLQQNQKDNIDFSDRLVNKVQKLLKRRK